MKKFKISFLITCVCTCSLFYSSCANKTESVEGEPVDSFDIKQCEPVDSAVCDTTAEEDYIETELEAPMPK